MESYKDKPVSKILVYQLEHLTQKSELGVIKVCCSGLAFHGWKV